MLLITYIFIDKNQNLIETAILRERQRKRERVRDMATGIMEVLLVNAKGLGDTDFFGTYFFFLISLCVLLSW